MNVSILRREYGFTILELMVIIGIAGVLAALAIPQMQNMIRSNQVAGQNNELIALIHLARNEAIRRNPVGNQTVRVELVASADGWEGFVRPPGDDETAEGCPVGAIRCSDHEDVILAAADNETFLIRFDNRGYSVDGDGGPVGVRLFLIHVNCANDLQSRSIRILPSGQVESRPANCSPMDT